MANKIQDVFAKRMGRPVNHTPESLAKAAAEYFEWAKGDIILVNEPIKSGELAGTCMQVERVAPMTIPKFCLFAGIDRRTFLNYCEGKSEAYADIFPISREIKEIIDSNQLDGAAVGVFKENIIGRVLGLKDHSDITSGDEPIKQVTVFQLPDDGRNKS